MKRAWFGFVLALCALPAYGETPIDAPPTEVEILTLTPIDSLPTKDEIVSNFEVTDPVVRLKALAMTPTVDFGIQLRAIRALPQFCPSGGGSACNGTAAHDAVLEVIQSVPPDDRSGRAILRLRAGIEALGAVKTGNPADVALLVDSFLDHSSRDIRAATARALRDMCQTAAIVPLRARYQQEQVAQVRLAISAALRDLGQCQPSS